MVRNIFTAVVFSLLCTQAANAGFLDRVGNLIDSTFTPAQNDSELVLNTTVAAEHKLPAHWRAYWLAEPGSNDRIFIADAGNIQAPVIILVHGLGQNGLRDWLTITPDLEKQYRVIMIDLPGFANSPSPKTKLSPTYYADVLHVVKPYFSNKPVTVVGHSMGGAVTLRYAQRYPDDVNQIALIDAAGILQRTAFVKHSATDRIRTNPDTMPNALLNHAVGLQDLSNSLIEKMLKLPDPTSLLGRSEIAWGTTLQKFPNVNAALGLTEEDFSSAIFEQTKPVFILWGNKDTIAPPRTGQLLAANLVSSEITIIEEAGHVPMASHAKEVSQWLLTKLNTTPAPLQQPAAINTANKESYTCKDKTGETIKGHYTRISLHNCTGILLDAVTANELIIEDSTLEIQHSHFREDKNHTIKNAVILMTGGSISGTINLDGSRVDFAGVRFHKEKPFNITRKSRLILSTSQAANNRYLHQDISLENIIW